MTFTTARRLAAAAVLAAAAAGCSKKEEPAPPPATLPTPTMSPLPVQQSSQGGNKKMLENIEK